MSFIQSPLMDLFEQQLINNPNCLWDVGFALQNDMTSVYRHDVMYRVKIPKPSETRPQRNLVVEGFSTAKSGTGKSTVFVGEAWKLMTVNYPDYDAEKFVDKFVHFTIAEFSDKVKLTKEMPAVCHVFDETRKSESLGMGSTAFISKVSDIVSVCRIKGLSVFRIMPSEARHKTINPHYRIDVNKIDYETNSNLSLLQDNDLRYRGFIVTFKPQVKELWRAYEDKKLDFVEKTLSDKHDERFNIYEQMAQKLVKDAGFRKCRNTNDRLWVAMKVLGSELPKNVLRLVINEALNQSR